VLLKWEACDKMKKKLVISVFLSMLMFASIFAGVVNSQFSSSSNNDEINAPSWKEDFSWTYDMVLDCELPYFGISFDGAISDIVLTVVDVGSNMYDLSISIPAQNIGTGEVTLPGVDQPISGTIKLTSSSGTLNIDKSNLGLIGGNVNLVGYFDKAIDIHFNINIDLEIQDFDYNDEIYDTLDFPLDDAKEWFSQYRILILHYAGTVMGIPLDDRASSDDDLDPFEFLLGGNFYRCLGRENVNTAAGNYEAMKIERYLPNVTSQNYIWYAPTVGNIVKIDYSSIDLGNLVFSEFSLNLKDTNYNNPPTAPEKPTSNDGGEDGRAGPKYTYCASGGIDEDGHKVQYGFDWNGDGVVDDWTDDLVDSGEMACIEHSFSSEGTYHIKAKTRDERGAESEEWSPELTVHMDPNSPPSIPAKPIGDITTGTVGFSYEFSTFSSDQVDEDKIEYGWDLNGDGTVDIWDNNDGNYYPSGETADSSLIWTESGTFDLKVKARDEYGAESEDWSQELTITMENSPPGKPNAPSGTTNGKKGTTYTYTTSAIDPDGHAIKYWFDWGDGTNSGWVGPFESGTTAQATHKWDQKGDYQIKVKAKDEYDSEESDWSDPLPISMPKSRFYGYNILNKILENIKILKEIYQNTILYKLLN